MKIRRALLSVSDKSGIVELAQGLAACGIDLLSTGGTYQALQKAEVPVLAIDSYTGSPEVMGGRVKTLHPRVHGGILAREGVDDADLQRLGAQPIDLVVVNLYPFEQTLARGDADFDALIEQIDIGGPCMLRASAKNHARVTVVCEPARYGEVLENIRLTGGVPPALRQTLAQRAFAHTARYDSQIAAWLSDAQLPGNS